MRSRGPLLPTKRAVRDVGRKRSWLPWALLFVVLSGAVYFIFLGTDHEDGTARVMRDAAERARLSRLQKRASAPVEPVVEMPKGVPDPGYVKSEKGQTWQVGGGVKYVATMDDSWVASPPQEPVPITHAKVPDDIGFVNDIVKEIPPQFRMTPEEKADYLRDKARMKEENDEYRRAHAGDTPGVGVPRWDNEATREVEAEPEKGYLHRPLKLPILDNDDASDNKMWSEEQCEVAAQEWVDRRERDYAARMAKGGKSDLLFFLHIPRTAGRSFHFCFLKLATLGFLQSRF